MVSSSIAYIFNMYITFIKIAFRMSDNLDQDRAWLPWVWSESKNFFLSAGKFRR